MRALCTQEISTQEAALSLNVHAYMTCIFDVSIPLGNFKIKSKLSFLDCKNCKCYIRTYKHITLLLVHPLTDILTYIHTDINSEVVYTYFIFVL